MMKLLNKLMKKKNKKFENGMMEIMDNDKKENKIEIENRMV